MHAYLNIVVVVIIIIVIIVINIIIIIIGCYIRSGRFFCLNGNEKLVTIDANRVT